MDLYLPSAPALAIHLTSRGFGWALFDEMGVLTDWGMASAGQGRKLRLVNRFRRILARHEPVVLVVEADQGGQARVDRIRKLYRAFERAASGIGAATCAYDREAVAGVLGLAPSASRHEVALRVAGRLIELSHRMPRKPAFGAAEDSRRSLFAAAALGLAHLIERGVLAPPVHPGAPE